MTPRPPRFLEWLLDSSVHDGVAGRDAVLGDLAEEFAALARSRGRTAATTWYARQVLRSVVPNIVRAAAAVRAGMAADLRGAIRHLRRRPGFAATAVLTAALGIGAASAVFAVVDGAVLRGLSIPAPDRVVALWSRFDRQAGQDFPISAAEFTDLRTDVRSFALTGAWSSGETLLEPRGGDARTVEIATTVGDIYAIAGARIVIGRLPSTDDDRVGAPPVALLAYQFWRDVYGGDTAILGTQTVLVGSQRVPIIGVLAPEVRLPGSQAAAWIHQVLDPATWATNRSGHGLNVLARLRDDASESSARAELATLEARWAERYAGQHSLGLDGHRTQISSVTERVLGRARRVSMLLSIAAMLLLALACANVANLLLARAETQRADVGVRKALGASSSRVLQPILIEGLLLGALGGVCGLALTAAGLPALMRLAPDDLGAAAIRLDVRVAIVTAAISAFSGLLFAIAPAWTAMRRNATDLLRTASRSQTGGTRGLRWLVGSQAALATALLAAAGLLTTSLYRLTIVDSGLDPEARVTLDVTLPASRYRDAAAIAAFYDAALARLRALPGVHSAAAVRMLPLRDSVRRENVIREGGTAAADRIGVGVQAASADALRTLGVPLIDGRDLTTADRAGALHVALINQSAAKILWPGQPAIGQRFQGTFLPPAHGLVTIVGVYGDVRSAGLASVPTAEILLPAAQLETMAGYIRNMTVVLHTSVPVEIVAAARTAIRDLDAAIAVESPATMADVLRRNTARERFLAVVVAIFGALALGIAAIGVFGVVSFTIARQTRELAIRHALGAARARIFGRVLAQSALMSGTGAIAGAVAVWLASPAFSSLLHDASPRDSVVLVGAAFVLVGCAVAASLSPAARAMRVPLSTALQEGGSD